MASSRCLPGTLFTTDLHWTELVSPGSSRSLFCLYCLQQQLHHSTRPSSTGSWNGHCCAFIISSLFTWVKSGILSPWHVNNSCQCTAPVELNFSHLPTGTWHSPTNFNFHLWYMNLSTCLCGYSSNFLSGRTRRTRQFLQLLHFLLKQLHQLILHSTRCSGSVGTHRAEACLCLITRTLYDHRDVHHLVDKLHLEYLNNLPSYPQFSLPSST